MNDFTAGFETSTNEIVLFIIVFGVVIVGLIIGRLVRGRSKPRRKTKSTGSVRPVLSSMRRVHLDELSLTRADRTALQHLAWLLKNPNDLEALVNDRKLFTKAARKALVEGIIDQHEAVQLARRLNVPRIELETALHSERIPIGSVVSVSDRQLNVATGKLVETGKHGMRVRMGRGKRGISDRSRVEVLINAPQGMYRMQSVVEARHGNELVLRRASQVEHVQRRRYRRREALFHLSLTRIGLNEPARETDTEDISIGGAAIKNPGKRLGTGDLLECSISTQRSGTIAVRGTVVRTSRGGRTAHIAFARMDDATQHRLFRAILSAGRT